VQTLLSLQVALLLLCRQPAVGLHESSVHDFESLHASGVAPGSQPPLALQ